jgi:hypothetical protein
MNRRLLVRLALALAVALAPVPALAQNPLEILTLRHRTADEVIPPLRPLLEPGATLSGRGSQLFVRASPANLDDLRLALEALDRPGKRLQISVRFDESREAGRVRVEAQASGSRINLRADQSQRASGERIDQRVQVLEGARAVIYSGRSRPTRQRIRTPGGVIPQEVTVLHDQATGFEVVPRLSGKTVQLEIAGQAGAAHTATTVQAELGQWIHLGSASRAGAYRSEMQGVWLKVEEMAD